MNKLFLTLLLSLSFQLSNAQQHFISDAQYRDTVEQAFRAKLPLIQPLRMYIIDPFRKLKATPREIEALKFLYAYMPTADGTDYSVEFYLQNVRQTFKTQAEMPWGKKVPELLFRHFVLPLRVNNENLDSARMVFYRELKERVSGLSMKDAILEVNHWCHEHVTYTPSDARTLSPLACMRNALGRCGEESTFTVAALRSVGIPARQVYTPRWAHTDDNHAWVEAWADGTWYFLGACEPEAVLNLGWFNAPASRAMLMHTRAFGNYKGPEEVMLRTSNYTEINLIGNYAATARVDFRVVMPDGMPADRARVEFKIYNYAEFYTAVNKYTDDKGQTFLTAGKGDMLVWASKNGRYGFAKASFGRDKLVTITLNHDEKTDKAQQVFDTSQLDIVPPAEHAVMPEVTDEQANRNKQRFAQEDSIRKAYEATFFKAADYPNLSAEKARLLTLSRGNWRTILAFLKKHKDNEARAISLLQSISTKDLRDMPMPILDDSYLATSNQLSPRVEDEMIIAPFKRYFEKHAFIKSFIKECQNDPSKLVKWVKQHIRINPDKGSLRIAQTPVAVMKTRITDTRSRDIFFVDLARSLNIEARKDVVTSKVQYKQGGQWVDVNFDAAVQQPTPTGTLVLKYTPTPLLDAPKYYSHFSISKIENGSATLLNFDEGEVDMGGGQGLQAFRKGVTLDQGTYLLVTGTRLANGTVLATHRTFNIRAGQTTDVDLTMRTSATEVSVIGSFNSEDKFLKEGREVSILSQTGRGYFVVGILGVGQEPTNHALRDIAKMKTELDKWGRPFVLLFESEAEARKFKADEFGQLPRNTIFGVDRDGAIKREIVTAMKLKNDRLLPVFIIADTFNRIVFSSQGYTIGLGEQIKKVADKL